MSSLRILIDFGSTYTKALAVDTGSAEVLAAARVPSTVETDITIGLRHALDILEETVPASNLEEGRALACSSAAGGLRMVCIGFVPELTSEAANRAALGAGAKVVGVFSYRLNRSELAKVEALKPDILLLTGGTDGGDTATIVHNARMLANTGDAVRFIIVAGNKSARDDIEEAFAGTGKTVLYANNVMPEIGRLDLTECNREIRDLFMKNITVAKGIGKAREIIGDVIMPTPSAVLEAARLVANGPGGKGGFGELVVVDVGGATTDVHSIAKGNPARPDTVTIGLPEPYEKRTVEGDLGLKHSLESLCEVMAGQDLPPYFNSAVSSFRAGNLPSSSDELDCHRLLTACTVETAMDRHAGRLEEVYGPMGRTFVQRGKDLTKVGTVIGTGGPLIFNPRPADVLSGVVYNVRKPGILKPESPRFYLDTGYVLYAAGLLARDDPALAFRLAEKYVKGI